MPPKRCIFVVAGSTTSQRPEVEDELRRRGPPHAGPSPGSVTFGASGRASCGPAKSAPACPTEACAKNRVALPDHRLPVDRRPPVPRFPRRCSNWQPCPEDRAGRCYARPLEPIDEATHCVRQRTSVFQSQPPPRGQLEARLSDADPANVRPALDDLPCELLPRRCAARPRVVPPDCRDEVLPSCRTRNEGNHTPPRNVSRRVDVLLTSLATDPSLTGSTGTAAATGWWWLWYLPSTWYGIAGVRSPAQAIRCARK